MGTRSAVMLAAAFVGAGCAFDSSGKGAATESGTTTTSSSSTGTTTTPATTSSTTATTTATSNSGGETSTGADPRELVSRGLLVRYFLDEGEGVDVGDAADNPFNLGIVSSDGQPVWTDESGRAGLVYTAVQENGWVDAPAIGTKVEDRLRDATAVTVETVVDVKEASDQGSRIVHLGPDGTNDSDLALSIMPERVEFRLAVSADDGRTWPSAPVLAQGRVVLHLVVDMDAADAEQRARLYVDGVEQTPEGLDSPAQGASIPVSAEARLGLFNRPRGDRTFVGSGLYAAVYDVAFTPEEVSTNATRLLASDDR